MVIAGLVAVVVLTLLAPLGHGPRRRAVIANRPGSEGRARPVEPPRDHRAVIAVGMAVAAGAGVVTAGILPTLSVGIALVAWPMARRVGEQRAAHRRIDAALPSTIEMLVLVIDAGLTPHQAIEFLCERAPTPARPAVREVRRRTSRGTPLAEALSALPEILGPPAAHLADTLAMAERHGTPIAHALEQLSLDARERRRRHAEAAARTLPVRMSFPLVSCTLPSFVLVAIAPAVMAAMASLGDSGV